MKKTANKIDWGLFFICLFLGWLGIDKFYYMKSFKAAWKFALVKFGFFVIIIGIFWWIWDVIMVLCKRYQFDARDYFL